MVAWRGVCHGTGPPRLASRFIASSFAMNIAPLVPYLVLGVRLLLLLMFAS